MSKIGIRKNITDQQIIDTLGLTIRAASLLLDCDPANVVRRRQSLVSKGVWKPEDHPGQIVPDGYRVKGKSILFDKNGNPTMTWVKSDTDWERRELIMQEALDAMRSEIPRAEPTRIPAGTNSDICNLFILTDFHLGMKAWHEETGGDDWDLEIAERLMMGWIDNALSRTTRAGTAVFAQMGDFLHWDGMEAVTPRNKHVLDADTRYQKLVRVAIRLTRHVIAQLLASHARVVLIQTGGNHDPSFTRASREWMAALYENEPRLVVDTGAGDYFAYQHGETSIFFAHGDKAKGQRLVDAFISNFRCIFGATKYSYAHIGHYHHQKGWISEGVMQIEQHRTLAPKDSHAAAGGWVSGRDAKVIQYHARYGEVSRISVTPEMLK